MEEEEEKLTEAEVDEAAEVEEEETPQAETSDEQEQREAIEALNNMDEDGDDGSVELSFRTLIGGDLLRSRFMLKQIFFVFYCVFLMILYTANRYSSQDEVNEIDKLRKDLQDIKYNVLTQSSELMNYTLQSNVEDALKHTPDSVLTSPDTAPYLIRRDSVEEDDSWFNWW